MSTIISVGVNGYSYTCYVVSNRIVGAYLDGHRVFGYRTIGKLQEAYDAGR